MAFWFALAVLFIGIIAGIVYAVLKAIKFWRDAKRVSGTVGAEVDRVSRASERIEHHLANAEVASRRLKEAGDRLAVSRARLDVQLAAVREARTQVRRVFWFVPGL